MREPDEVEARADEDGSGYGGEPADGKFDHEGVCASCGASAHLHEGLCRPCHRKALDERRAAVPEHHEPHRPLPHQAPAVPLHGPPVRRRGA
jgi:predicted amidophosphoribosyltransferase